jgi:hypothetical protein
MSRHLMRRPSVVAGQSARSLFGTGATQGIDHDQDGAFSAFLGASPGEVELFGSEVDSNPVGKHLSIVEPVVCASLFVAKQALSWARYPIPEDDHRAIAIARSWRVVAVGSAARLRLVKL